MKRVALKWLGVGVAALAVAGAAEAQVRGVSKSEIVIGMHTDLSGPLAVIGAPSANGARLRAEEVNGAGGIHGRKIRFLAEDSQYQVPRAVQAANKLLNRDKIFVMLGSIGTAQNNAVLPDQLKAGVPNMFPLTAARQMYHPLHKMKFSGGSSYYDQIRAGIKWMVEKKGKKTVCALYNDTDFGQEVYEGIKDQLAAMNLKLAEAVTNKPTDTDYTAHVAKLRAANCDLVAMGTVVRDTILPYGTARKMGWTNVDFIGQVATYFEAVAAAPGGATEGYYTTSGVVLPYRDAAAPNVVAWMDKYKAKYGSDPNQGALYGYTYMDLVVQGLDRAGPNLTTDGFLKAVEQLKGYRDFIGGLVYNFGPDNHQGTNASYLLQVQKGRFVVLEEGLRY